jgi:hypothetical protein
VRTISVAHATVTQNVSHFPVMPKYGCDPPNIVMIGLRDAASGVEGSWADGTKIDVAVWSD